MPDYTKYNFNILFENIKINKNNWLNNEGVHI